MHGVIHDCLRELILQKYGEQTWKRYCKEHPDIDEVEDFKALKMHDDAVTIAAIAAAASTLGVSVPTALEVYGEFFYHYSQQRGYAAMLHQIGRDFEAFLNNLDFHHLFISNFIYGSLKSPSFRCEATEDESALDLYYYSLARECALQIFHQQTKFEVVENSQETVKFGVRGAEQKSTRFCCRMKVTLHGVGNMPHASLTSLHRSSRYESEFGGSGLSLSAADLMQLHPFHVLFNRHFVILSVGAHLLNMMGIGMIGSALGDYLEIQHPHVIINWKKMSQFLHSNFIVKITSKTAADDSIALKGAMYLVSAQSAMLFVGSPKVNTLSDLSQSSLYLSDIPLYDRTRELTLLNQQRVAEVDLSKKLEESTSQLQRMGRQLEAEKEKVDILLEEMLPKTVADSLKEGRQVEACHYECVTILFSDIVTFTVISSQCHPSQVVNMLNSLFTFFDDICTKYDVYKVETIGDAYMIASGLPTQLDNHAQLMANVALDMCQKTSLVNSPADQSPLRIRVGMHSGSCMTGVVGVKRPRYCLFGDTVNVASRMESHGVPGKTHVSDACARLGVACHNQYSNIGVPFAFSTLLRRKFSIGLLHGHGFRLEPRGATNIKGKGKMQTWFLVGRDNEPAADTLPPPCNGVQRQSSILKRFARRASASVHSSVCCVS